MPISPGDVKPSDTNEDYERLTRMIDSVLSRGRYEFDVAQYFDREEIINRVIVEYKEAGWSVNCTPCDRMIQHNNVPSRHMTKILTFTPIK